MVRCAACELPLEPTGDCPACDGGATLEVRSRWMRAAARRAAHLARVYRAEEGKAGRRERECLEEARVCRARARELATLARARLVAPALAKTASGARAAEKAS